MADPRGLDEKKSDSSVISAAEMAKQIIICSAKLYMAIPDEELAVLKSAECKGYQEFLKQHNNLGRSIIGNILAEDTVAGRAAKIAYWAEVLDICYKQRDYVAADAIHGALTHGSIGRLLMTKMSLDAATQQMLFHYKLIFKSNDLVVHAAMLQDIESGKTFIPRLDSFAAFFEKQKSARGNLPGIYLDDLLQQIRLVEEEAKAMQDGNPQKALYEEALKGLESAKEKNLARIDAKEDPDFNEWKQEREAKLEAETSRVLTALHQIKHRLPGTSATRSIASSGVDFTAFVGDPIVVETVGGPSSPAMTRSFELENKEVLTPIRQACAKLLEIQAAVSAASERELLSSKGKISISGFVRPGQRQMLDGPYNHAVFYLADDKLCYAVKTPPATVIYDTVDTSDMSMPKPGLEWVERLKTQNREMHTKPFVPIEDAEQSVWIAYLSAKNQMHPTGAALNYCLKEITKMLLAFNDGRKNLADLLKELNQLKQMAPDIGLPPTSLFHAAPTGAFSRLFHAGPSFMGYLNEAISHCKHLQTLLGNVGPAPTIAPKV